MSVSPGEVRSGDRIEVSLSTEAEERIETAGVAYFQVRGADGRWKARFALTTGYPGNPPTYPAGKPIVTRIRKDIPFLEVGGPPVEVDSEIYRIPDVRPGTYRLVKVLEPEDGSPGFGGLPERYAPKLATEIRVVG